MFAEGLFLAPSQICGACSQHSSLPGHRSRAGIPNGHNLAERMMAAYPNYASVLGVMGLLRKAREGFLVPDGPTNQL